MQQLSKTLVRNTMPFLAKLPLLLLSLLSDFVKLSQSPESGDVTVISDGGVRFPCHKIVLAHASKLLAADFASQHCQCQEVQIFCTQFSPESVRKVLDFVYNGVAEFAFNEYDLLLEVCIQLIHFHSHLNFVLRVLSWLFSC